MDKSRPYHWEWEGPPIANKDGRSYYEGCRQVFDDGKGDSPVFYRSGETIFCHVDKDQRPWVAQCIDFCYDPAILKVLRATAVEEEGLSSSDEETAAREIPAWMPMRVSLRWLYRLGDVEEDKGQQVEGHPCEVFFSDHVTGPEVNSVNIIDGRAELTTDLSRVPDIPPVSPLLPERIYLCRRFFRHSGAKAPPKRVRTSKYYPAPQRTWRLLAEGELDAILKRPSHSSQLYFSDVTGGGPDMKQPHFPLRLKPGVVRRIVESETPSESGQSNSGSSSSSESGSPEGSAFPAVVETRGSRRATSRKRRRTSQPVPAEKSDGDVVIITDVDDGNGGKVPDSDAIGGDIKGGIEDGNIQSSRASVSRANSGHQSERAPRSQLPPAGSTKAASTPRRVLLRRNARPASGSLREAEALTLRQAAALNFAADQAKSSSAEKAKASISQKPLEYKLNRQSAAGRSNVPRVDGKNVAASFAAPSNGAAPLPGVNARMPVTSAGAVIPASPAASSPPPPALPRRTVPRRNAQPVLGALREDTVEVTKGSGKSATLPTDQSQRRAGTVAEAGAPRDSSEQSGQSPVTHQSTGQLQQPNGGPKPNGERHSSSVAAGIEHSKVDIFASSAPATAVSDAFESLNSYQRSVFGKNLPWILESIQMRLAEASKSADESSPGSQGNDTVSEEVLSNAVQAVVGKFSKMNATALSEVPADGKGFGGHI